jgi:hypothetical protein
MFPHDMIWSYLLFAVCLAFVCGYLANYCAKRCESWCKRNRVVAVTEEDIESNHTEVSIEDWDQDQDEKNKSTTEIK